MKKQLLAALAAVCLGGCLAGLTACVHDEPTPHTHDWSGWTVSETDEPSETATGKATRTCTGEGDCDAAEADKEYTLPVLTSADYTKSADTATCSAAGKINYIYNKNGVNVNFDIETPVNANAHKYGVYQKAETESAGHLKVCEHNGAHKTDVEAHDTKGENGACSECGYKANEHEHDWSAWTVTDGNKPTDTATGKATRTCANDDCNAEETDKEYTLPVLTSADYTKSEEAATIEAEGSVTYTYNKNDVNVSFTVTTPMLESKTYTVSITGAQEGVTVKLGKYSGTTNAEGVATVKAEVADYDVIIENDGYSYVAATVTSGNPAVTIAGLPVYRRGTITPERFDSSCIFTASGLYTTTIRALKSEEVADKYALTDIYFQLRSGDEAKKFTVKILSDNTTIAPDESGYEILSGAGESYSLVLEAGQNSVFSIVSDDEDVNADYTYKVVYEVTVEEAPAAGDFYRPAYLENNVQSTIEVSGADQKVYYKLDLETFGEFAEITFGDEVTVYNLGFNKNNQGTLIESGAVIEVSAYGTYLYARSSEGNCTITAAIHYVEGTKQKPITASFEEVNTPKLDIKEGVYEQWYKLEVTAGDTYIVKPDAAHAVLEVYADVDGEPVKTSSSGASVVVALSPDTPLYIKAYSLMNTKYNFTVKKLSDEDKGFSTDAPLELTVGEYKLYNKHYYTFVSEKDVVVELTAKDRTDNVFFYVNHNGFENYGSGLYSNGFADKRFLSFPANAGEIYYIWTTNSSEKDGGTFTLNIVRLEHDVTFTVTDGTDTFDGVKVTVTKGENEVASGVTAGGDVTLTLMPDQYTLKVENLPAGFGYYFYSFNVNQNDTEQLQFNITLTALEEYSLTVKLPDGSPAENVTVKFANAVAGRFTAVTGSDGVAKITQLPPVKSENGALVADSYAVTISLPENLKDVYSYNEDISLTATEPAKEITLTGYNAPDGTQSNPFTAEIGANSGTATENDLHDGEEYVKCYIYTAAEDGKLLFTSSDPDTVVCAVKGESADFDAATGFPTGYYILVDVAESFELAVKAGDVVSIIAGNINGTGEYSFELTFTENISEAVGSIEDPKQAVIGNNEGTTTESDENDGEEYVKCYIYTATADGKLLFASSDPDTVVCAVKGESADFDSAIGFPTGNYILVDVAESFELEVKAGDVVSIIAGNINGTGNYSFDLTFVEGTGSQESPFTVQIGANSGTATENDLNDGEEYVKCYIYTATADGKLLFTSSDPDTVVCAVKGESADFDSAIGFPTGNYILIDVAESFELEVNAGDVVSIIAGNINGTGKYSFDLTFVEGFGSEDSPFKAQSGANSGTTTEEDFNAETAESYVHFYVYEASANGTVTIGYTAGTNTVVCATTTTYEEALEFGDGNYALPDDVESFDLKVNAGDKVYILAGCFGEAGAYSFDLTFTAD